MPSEISWSNVLLAPFSPGVKCNIVSVCCVRAVVVCGYPNFIAEISIAASAICPQVMQCRSS